MPVGTLHSRLIFVGFVVAAAASQPGCDSPNDRPTDFRYLHTTIVAPSCATASCHSAMTKQAGIDLSTVDGAYTVLTGLTCRQLPMVGDTPGNYVIPGDPERSKLMYQLRGDNTHIMPPDIPVPATEITEIENWIVEGAPCE